MSYDIEEEARFLCIMVGVSGDFKGPISSAMLETLQVAQAEAWTDAIGLLHREGYAAAARLLESRAETMWCGRYWSTPTSAARPGPARPTPAPPEPGPPATPLG